MSDASSKDKEEQSPKRPSARVRWSPVIAILYTSFLYFGSQFFAGLVLAALVVLTGRTIESEIAGQFYFVVLSDAVMVLLLWWFLRAQDSGWNQIGLGRRPIPKDIGYALVAYVAYFGLLVAVLTVIGPLTGIDLEQKQELGFESLYSQTEKLMGFIALVVLAPIVEEVVFRGFLFTSLRKKMTFFWATLVTSLLFASPHLLATSEGLLWVAGVDTLVLSFALCYLREKTGALWAPIIVHAIKNGIAYMILLSSVAVL